MANEFKGGASQSRTTSDFNARAARLSERLGDIKKPVDTRRNGRDRWNNKSKVTAAAAANDDKPVEATETEQD